MITGSGGVTSSGASGAGMASQLGDLGLVLTSPTVLTAGLNCSIATPCNTRLGNTVYSITSSSTITLSSGSGTRIYRRCFGCTGGRPQSTLTCSGVCGAIRQRNAFRRGRFLFTWTATNGVWDINGSDKRAFLSTRYLGSGVGKVAGHRHKRWWRWTRRSCRHTSLRRRYWILRASCPGIADSALTLPGASAGDSWRRGGRRL